MKNCQEKSVKILGSVSENLSYCGKWNRERQWKMEQKMKSEIEIET